MHFRHVLKQGYGISLRNNNCFPLVWVLRGRGHVELNSTLQQRQLFGLVEGANHAI
jgi:hypothetical protein